ncbi:MAG: hypothetical protein QMC90_01765 [Dehalococcoidales bacterium]|nr:hypothetical protein [Dehalococcoidales bacterium]
MTSGWKLGHHYLTNKRLLFFQSSGTVYETPLSNIISITLEKKKYVLGRTKEVICLSYDNRGRTVRIWLIMGDLETWRKRLSELILLDEKAVDKVARQLDLPCSQILWYLWEHRHASIDDLAQLVDAPSHMDILHKIRGVINPVAEEVIGNPILEFERARVDPETGERVLFSWWIIGRKRPEERREEALVDVFDEGDHLTIIIELVGIQEEDIRLGVEGSKLVVSAENSNKEYHEEIALPAIVNSFTTKFNNNILEVRLEKDKYGSKSSGANQRAALYPG